MMDAIAPIACPSGSNNDMPSDDRSARGDFAAQFTSHNHHEVALSR
jgi:hypothetical protein